MKEPNSFRALLTVLPTLLTSVQRCKDNIWNYYLLNIRRNDAVYFTNLDLDNSNITGDWSVYEGQSVSLICHGNGNPRPEYTWHLNGEQLKTNSRITMPENQLNIFNATTSESGEYKCVAANRIGKVVNTVEVTVRG